MEMKFSRWLAVWFLAALVAGGISLAAPKDNPDYELGSLSKKFYLGIYRRQLERNGFQPEELNVYAIGQSHIDAAWRWRYAQTHKKCQRTFGKAIYHIEKYPFFTYSQSAPQYYEWVLQDAPELFAKIQEAAAAGRWEIVGGQWVEPDGNMPDGESFVRQRLYGQRFYLEHFGRMSDLAWMLDSFGYNWNLPQIMAKSGAKYMWTSKLTWNDTTIFPFHLFWWEGVDGSRVLTHICPISPYPAYFPIQEVSKFKETRYLLKPGVQLTADYATEPAEIQAALSSDWIKELAIVYGVGDGGLGPIEKEILIQKAMADQGWSKFGTAHQLFSALEQYQDRIPVWKDEMYLEYHRGVLTTHAWIKRLNRQSEQLMRTAEVIRSRAMELGLEYPAENFLRFWKTILLNQFHDVLPGSSIPEVYEDVRPMYAQVHTALAGIIKEGMAALAEAVDTRPPSPAADLEPVVVFNSLSWPRSELVSLVLLPSEEFRVLDDQLREVPAEVRQVKLHRELVFRAEEVPALGARVFFLQPGSPASQGPRAVEQGGVIILENDLVKVAVDKRSGWLTSLWDKRTGQELLNGYGNQLLAFYDRPKMYSAWNIDADYINHPLSVSNAASVEISYQGSLSAEVTVSRTFDRSRIKQIVRLVAGDPRVYLDWDIDFHQVDNLFKQGFDTAIRGDKIAAEISYAVIEYPTHPRTPAQKAQFEMPCQKWIDLSDGKIGLALLNRGKYGFSRNADGTGFRLSLIRGAHYPRANPGAENVSHHIWSPLPRFQYTDQGENFFETALLPHAGDWRAAKIWRAGYEFNTPLEAVRTDQHAGTLAGSGSWIHLEGEEVYLGAVKKAEDDNDLVLRLVEAAGRNSRALLKFESRRRLSAAMETDLLELNPRPISFSGNTIALELAPFEIKTLKVSLK